MDQNIRKYVVWYQGGSGGFLLCWLLQLAHDDRGAKSPSHVIDALNCFPLILKDNTIEWKKYELTPPDIGLLCNTFHNLYKDHIEEDVYELLQRIINRDITLYSDTDFRIRIKFYFCNYVWRRATAVSMEKSSAADFGARLKHEGNLLSIIKLSDLLFDPDKVLFITAPYKFLRLCEDEKVCGIGDLESSYSGNFERNIYITPIINNYKDKLNIFPIESVWEGTWQQYIEQFLNRQLTPHQQQVCQLLISRWLYVTPQNIKDEFNI